jgi:hypothetical protein
MNEETHVDQGGVDQDKVGLADCVCGSGRAGHTAGVGAGT